MVIENDCTLINRKKELKMVIEKSFIEMTDNKISDYQIFKKYKDAAIRTEKRNHNEADAEG